MKVISIISSELGTNSYLILAKKPALIDAGTYPDKILDEVKKHVKVEDLEYIILTHYHFDHVTAASKLKKETSAKILIHELDEKYLNFKPDKTLKDNEIIDLDDVKLKVVHTPGHSPGSICLYEPESKSLFSGDTIFLHGGVGRTDLQGGNTEQLMKSLERISRLDVKTLYPGHG
jgi:glyoxylase-like metal-dependent hydrolase (beta-lactamase superfamily II)